MRNLPLFPTNKHVVLIKKNKTKKEEIFYY